MAKRKILGKGSVVYYDLNNDGDWKLVGCILNFTPPPQERERTEVACLSDLVNGVERDLVTSVKGMEQLSDFVFETVKDPADQSWTDMQTLYNRTGCDDNVACGWRNVYTYCGATVTQQFSGQVISVVPGQIVKDQVVSETVTVERTTPITTT